MISFSNYRRRKHSALISDCDVINKSMAYYEISCWNVITEDILGEWRISLRRFNQFRFLINPSDPSMENARKFVMLIAFLYILLLKESDLIFRLMNLKDSFCDNSDIFPCLKSDILLRYSQGSVPTPTRKPFSLSLMV